MMDLDHPMMAPDLCQTMADVRAGVDGVDRTLMRLLAQRFGYMRAAARIKAHRDDVRDEARKRQVIENACADAAVLGVPVTLIAPMWDQLVEASIAYELAEFDDRRTQAQAL